MMRSMRKTCASTSTPGRTLNMSSFLANSSIECPQ
jgi:hypothetical protein